MRPRPPIVFVNVEDGDFERATLTFLELLCQNAEGRGPPMEPPITRCPKLEKIAARRNGECMMIHKPRVCRRINFDDPDDDELERKKADLRLMILSSRSKQRQMEEKEAAWKQQKLEGERKPRKLGTATRYSSKMRCL